MAKQTNYCKSKSQELADRAGQKHGKKWETKMELPAVQSKTVHGKRLKYLAMKTVDQAEIMKGYKPEMFTLENLIDSGAVNQLTEGRITQSQMMIIDKLEQGASSELARMEAEEWAEKYIAQTKQKNTTTKKEEE